MNSNEKSKDTGKSVWPRTRAGRRMLIGLAWLVTLVALFYAEEDWRGWHAWNQYRQQLEAAGEQLDYKTFIPKPIPDDQNFAALPLIESWFTERTNFDKRWADNYFLANQIVDSPTSPTTSTAVKDGNRHLTDLVAWGMAFDMIRSGHFDANRKFKSGNFDPAARTAAAPAVLAGLETNNTVFTELRDASQRIHSRYPVVYDLDNPWGILLPHLGNIKTVVQRLQLTACAELAAGRSDNALADVKLSLCLADSVKDEPFLISYLVRLACMQIALQPVWEGLAGHAWSDAQLQELQARFQQYDFVADMKRPLDGERAAGVMTADLLARGKYHLNDLTGDPNQAGSTLANLFGRIAPRGWYHLEQLSYARLFQLQLAGAFDANRKRVFPERIASNKNALEQAFAGRNPVTTICTRHQLLAVMMLPALSRVPIKAAAAQTAADEAVLACALERYRLANGQFPGTLDALVPRFISQLPNDVISGQPYKYHLTNDGQFVLYSIGWNETDDGGVPGKTLFDEKEGDWVWQQSAK
ncbi:MAG: hypothetical protein ABSD57_05640 [Verrucomicrobiota bacterium]|jgi:hypothetical protein